MDEPHPIAAAQPTADAVQKAEVEISAVVTRADGTVEDLGVIASTADGTVTIEEKD